MHHITAHNTAQRRKKGVVDTITMADREAQQNIYSYNEMSSKVMQADRSARRGRNEPTGEVESLRGREDVGRMGDRVVATGKTTRSSEVEAKLERANKKRQKREGGKRDSLLGASGGQTILDVGSLTGYQPSTPASQAAYENLLVRNAVICTVVVAVMMLCVHSFHSIHFHTTFSVHRIPLVRARCLAIRQRPS